MSETGGLVLITSDLDIQAGPHHARLVANGTHLRLVTDDAAGLWSQAPRAANGASPTSARTVAGQAAEALVGAGLSLEVTGSRGTVIEIGRDRASRAGRIATGSPHIRLGRPLAVIILAWRLRRRCSSAP
jgi:hypothetical protein